MKSLSCIYDDAIDKSKIYGNPTSNWDIFEFDKFLSRLMGKKVSGQKSTGVISKINFESLREDRYTSVDIDWEHGGKSYGVFLNNDYVTVYGV